ncbi:iron-sulfur cluster biosynthesis transcriptional regulator SufR [Meiothermus luteus]|jgi:predicted ArsR family transcriptional regulator|uniref:Iron-sulfur cluster biosynthesis transcriptional regulator SufR n=1 Tax=Meiothermus luteus TaxID=2026184 RepID=A0A399EWD3_9DEIN|nr:ArsR family transcriptional regulator [Meiothermus luteus]RIH87399.1 iron-sulfur cluster biosynthesis transcriptional regulator SufR [Meiothermus luteus]RMH55547.1 MAG: ArsR family transcriptional regulator [Deinococcota bacterium]
MAFGLGETKLRILETLRTRSSCAGSLAESLGISRVAVHRHLEDLEREGLVRARIEKPEGRGRPKQVYEAVDEQAPYARMCADVLTHIKELFGAGVVLEVLSQRNEKLLQELAPHLEGLSLEQKIYRLAEFLTERGYQAHFYHENGAWYLEQGRCPKLALSLEHAELCEAELLMYQKLLGAPILREERIAAGGKCCRYRIAPQEEKP